MSKELERGEVFEGSFDALKDSAWLSAADLPWDRDTPVCIEAVVKRKDVRFQAETKSVYGSLKFKGKRKELGLNAGHRAILKQLFGDAKNARGKWIALYVDPEVQFGPKIVPGVRIRARKIDPPTGAAATAAQREIEVDDHGEPGANG